MLWQSFEVMPEFFKLCVRHVYCQSAAINTISFDPTHNPLRDAARLMTTLEVCVASIASTILIEYGFCKIA
jgi:hypothetical protein